MQITRSNARIPKFCQMLSVYWSVCPDLRFWQVVELIKLRIGKDDPFYVEDEETLEAMKRMYEK